MDFYHKFLGLCSTGLLVALLCLYFAYRAETAQNALLRQENVILDQTLKEEQTKAQKAISDANRHISQYELDKAEYKNRVSLLLRLIDEKTQTEESQILDDLQKDSSFANQLKIIEGNLHDFSNQK